MTETFPCGHRRSLGNTHGEVSRGKYYEYCRLCRRRTRTSGRLSKEKAAKLADGLKRIAERLSPAADPEQFMDKGDASTTERRSIGQTMNEGN